jgi:hypothetical protein
MQIAAHLSGIAENSALLMKCNQITANNERDARSGSGSALAAITRLVHKTLKSKGICRNRKIAAGSLNKKKYFIIDGTRIGDNLSCFFAEIAIHESIKINGYRVLNVSTLAATFAK